MRGSLLTIGLIFPWVLFAQSQFLMDAIDPQVQNSSILYSGANSNANPFLFNDYMKGELKMKNGSSVSDILLNIDIVSQSVVVKINDADAVLKPDAIQSLCVINEESDTLVFGKFPDKREFFQVLYKNNDLWFLKTFKKIRIQKTEVENTGYHTSGNSVMYKKHITYYLKNGDSIDEVQLSTKKVLALLGSQFSDCCNTTSCKLNKEETVVELLKKCK